MENIFSHAGQVATQAIMVCYFITNTFRLLSYLPQIIQVAKQKDDVKAISLWTWGMWTLANFTTALYAGFAIEVADPLLALLNLGNAVGCLSVILIVVSKRKAFAVRTAKTFSNNMLATPIIDASMQKVA